MIRLTPDVTDMGQKIVTKLFCDPKAKLHLKTLLILIKEDENGQYDIGKLFNLSQFKITTHNFKGCIVLIGHCFP